MNGFVEPGEYRRQRIRSVDLPPLPFWPAERDSAFEPVEVELDYDVAPLLHRLTKGAGLLEHAALIAATQVAIALHTGATVVAVGSPPRAPDDRSAAPGLLPIV